jgi:dihydrofolate reductase
MRKIIILSFISLDGVMQAPGGEGEDPYGGFNLEGWTVPYFDDTLGAEMGRQMTPPFDLLLGRTTYDIFAGYWPQQGADDPFKDARKYVVTSRPVNTDWHETIPIQGDVPAAIRAIKGQDGPPIQVHGSSQLIQTLLAYDLADELWLKIFPVVLGAGKRLFGPGAIPAAFQLTASSVSPSGVIMASYQRAGDVLTGSF